MEEEEIWELEFEKILGNGSFGIVYLIRDSKDDRRYAVKRINFQGQESERKVAQKEAEILSQVRHENILNYIESFEDEECLNIVTEYCDGGDLEVYLKQREGKSLPEVRICHWIHQIAAGLNYLHDKSILHRDLKTKNIFLMRDLCLKLGDLGIAKVLELNQSKAESFVGTPAYMSPELFKHLPYNHKSDIWSFGCCCYEMVALKKAFGNEEGLFALCKKVCSNERPPFPSYGYSDSLKSLVYSMLEELPECRPSADNVYSNPYIRSKLAKPIDKSNSPERNSGARKRTRQRPATSSKPVASARERRRRREEFRISRTFSGEWKHIKQQIQSAKLERKSVTKTMEKLKNLRLSHHKSESETTTDSCQSNDDEDSGTFTPSDNTVIERVRKFNSHTVGGYYTGDDDDTMGSGQGQKDLLSNPDRAAKQMVQEMRNNLTPFESLASVAGDDVFEENSSSLAHPSKNKQKKKKKILSKIATEKRQNGSSSSTDTGLGLSPGDISPQDNQNGEVRLFTHGQHVTFSKKEDMHTSNDVNAERYVSLGKNNRIASIKAVDSSTCMDSIPEIQLHLIHGMGEENLQRCLETMDAVKDEQIVKALLIEILGQTNFDVYNEQLFLLQMLQLNSKVQG